MKKLGIICLAIVLAGGMVATVSAGEHISKSTLNSMGLNGMQLISDHDGLAIRGKGYYHASSSVSVSGSSTANFYGGTTASNSYSANGRTFAAGGSVSVAGGVIGAGGSNGNFFVAGAATFAGGGAIAVAH
jgi:hypothetical protein